MAKERTLIGLELKEFLDCIRKDGQVTRNDPQHEMKEKIYVAVPSYAKGECCYCYVLAYCLDISNNTLQKTTSTKEEWCINFNDIYGQYYSTLASLLRICLLETDSDEKMQEISKIETYLNELLDGAVKLEILDEVTHAIRNNYGKAASEVIQIAQETISSYRNLLE